jgi:predicted NAD/FAD-binding protein
MKIAVVGAGIAGLSCAWRLSRAGLDVTLLEADNYFGGHSHTVDVTLNGITHGVDTGFLVFNPRTYPNLVRLFDALQVDTVVADMSFSVQAPLAGGRRLEWSGGNLDTVFAQRANLLHPRFLGMLRDILRFNRHAVSLADDGALPDMALGAFLTQNGYGAAFRDWYLLPMAGCIWSCPTEQMLTFPLAGFVRFCHNHGLLQVNGRPQWYTVNGGSRRYVEKILAAIPQRRLRAQVRSLVRGANGIRVGTDHDTERYDHVVLACHSDQALALLQDASADERTLLSAIRYQSNRAVLHTDASCLPRNRKTWSAWNYQRATGTEAEVCVHYLINRLQPLPFAAQVIVSLNPIDKPDPSRIVGEYDYAHPVLDAAAVAAQSGLDTIQGRRNTWFAGAWTGYGFHEDGLKSGLTAAEGLLARQAAGARQCAAA